jgi:hydroxymethylpyrimidine/phosphomethylpyrimidine kinase
MTCKALTIAGSDSGGGAGIQADLKTFTAFGVHGSVVLTAVTAQNTLGVQAAHELPINLIAKQFDSIMSDIGTDAAKTGMLASPQIVELVSAKLREWSVGNLVVDPVMVAKSGDPLLADDARETLIRQLVPLAAVLTPNRHETAVLTGIEVNSAADAAEAAKRLLDLGPRWVVIKGVSSADARQAIDIVTDGTDTFEVVGQRIETQHTHGTGCTYSAAIAAGLAQGLAPSEAIRKAKRYITAAIGSAPHIGAGQGPVDHTTGLQSEWTIPPVRR